MSEAMLLERAKKLGLHGLCAHWEEADGKTWVDALLDWEEKERARRSLERRIRRSKLGRFTLISQFDWAWPRKIERELVEELLGLGFLGEAANVVLIGPNGVGKTTIAKNIGYTALLAGHTVLSVTASEMLNDLASQDTSSALQRRLRCYVAPALLLVDEVGYLSYGSRHGDLFFEIVSRRHEKKSIVLTTNRPFAEWNEVFPNSSCVTALVDRLVHRAEIIKIEGGSYRAKEAKERADKNAKRRANRRKGP